LDLGTTFGYALGPRPLVSGSFHIKRDGRMAVFGDFLDKVQEGWRPRLVAYEQVIGAQKSSRAAQVYGGFQGILEAWADRHGITVVPVHVATIKKHVTGNARATKDEMIEAAARRGHLGADHNEADAIAILHYVLDTGINAMLPDAPAVPRARRPLPDIGRPG
jgi:Holliday junction resolvasome RuvABC endonuclease subunit